MCNSMILICLLIILGCCGLPRILHIPLDQRFTTRVAFLNLATITPFQVDTLPSQLLPALKSYPQPQQTIQWLISIATSQIYRQNKNNSCIISLEALLYGSLIASRISYDSYSQTQDRLNTIKNFLQQNRNLNVYMSAVVMRIPNYDLDFEEPEYWAKYGKLLYNYSYYLDKYNKTHDQADLEHCNQAKQRIPSDILSQFLWRRNRNQQILLDLLEMLNDNKGLVRALYITLDDNAKYGLNIAESEQLRRKVKEYGLQNIVRIYPGADEVAFSLLSRYMTDQSGITPIVSMYFRNQQTISNIPNYQGLPLIETIQEQIIAAGGSPFNGTLLKRGNITLLINNFDEQTQIEAPNQLKYPNLTHNYSQAFLSKLCYPTESEIYGFTDNRFSNGADLDFVDWIIDNVKNCHRGPDQWAYAGWNTNGNTLGTVISNSIILFISKQFKTLQREQTPNCEVCSPCLKTDIICSNSYFNILRILEDGGWQATLRQIMISYINESPGENINDLRSDMDFYKKFAYKSLNAQFNKLIESLSLPQQYSLTNIYYPWNRTFEIGLYGQLTNNTLATK